MIGLSDTVACSNPKASDPSDAKAFNARGFEPLSPKIVKPGIKGPCCELEQDGTIDIIILIMV